MNLIFIGGDRVSQVRKYLKIMLYKVWFGCGSGSGACSPESGVWHSVSTNPRRRDKINFNQTNAARRRRRKQESPDKIHSSVPIKT